MDSLELHGTGCVKCGERDLGILPYRVQIGSGGHASVVKFDERPTAEDGDTLHVTLEDGRGWSQVGTVTPESAEDIDLGDLVLK